MFTVDGPKRNAPAVVAASLDDFDQLAAIHSGSDLHVEQLSAGRFRGDYRAAAGRFLRAATLEFDQVLLIRGESAPGRTSAYPVVAENAGGLWHGRRLDPGRLVIHGPNAEADHHAARGCVLAELSAPADVLLQGARILRRGDVGEGPQTWSVVDARPEVAARLKRKIRLMMGLAFDLSVLDSAEGWTIEQACLGRLVDAVFPRCGGGSLDLPLGPRAVLARRAEDLIRSRLREPLGSIELCAELGVSERTLRRACRERWGMGPIDYARSLRLNAVRTELKVGAATAMVSETAKEWGFRHMGRFAVDYRRAFGERPSETARRA